MGAKILPPSLPPNFLSPFWGALSCPGCTAHLFGSAPTVLSHSRRKTYGLSSIKPTPDRRYEVLPHVLTDWFTEQAHSLPARPPGRRADKVCFVRRLASCASCDEHKPSVSAGGKISIFRAPCRGRGG